MSNRFVSGLSALDIVFKSGMRFRRTLEFSLVLSLAFIIILFLGWRRFTKRTRIVEEQEIVFQIENIPTTQQSRPRPAPSRPSVPIPSEDEEIPEEATIEFTNLLFDDEPLPLPPPPDDEDVILFVPFDEPPTPVGGRAAVLRNIKYPEIGRRAGIEGTVVLHCYVDEKGEIQKFRVIKDLGFGDFVEAAKKGILSVKWNPAKQRERPIAIWYSIPIQFTLTKTE